MYIENLFFGGMGIFFVVYALRLFFDAPSPLPKWVKGLGYDDGAIQCNVYKALLVIAHVMGLALICGAIWEPSQLCYVEWHQIGGAAVIVMGVVLSFCAFYLFAVKRKDKCAESMVGAITRGIVAFVFVFCVFVTLGAMMINGSLPFIFR